MLAIFLPQAIVRTFLRSTPVKCCCSTRLEPVFLAERCLFGRWNRKNWLQIWLLAPNLPFNWKSGLKKLEKLETLYFRLPPRKNRRPFFYCVNKAAHSMTSKYNTALCTSICIVVLGSKCTSLISLLFLLDCSCQIEYDFQVHTVFDHCYDASFKSLSWELLWRMQKMACQSGQMRWYCYKLPLLT